MDHTKKFVLMDPRFARPSMLDKTLSGLDTDISNILYSTDSDEIKVKKYISDLARFRNYSSPPKPKAILPPPPAPVITSPPPSVHASPATVAQRAPQKCSCKRVKTESLSDIPLVDSSLWRRTKRLQTKKRFGSQWIEYNSHSRAKKDRSAWIED